MKYPVFNKGDYESLYEGLRKRFEECNQDLTQDSALPPLPPSGPPNRLMMGSIDPQVGLAGTMNFLFEKSGSPFSFHLEARESGFFFKKSLVEISEEGLGKNESQTIDEMVCKYANDQGYKIKRL